MLSAPMEVHATEKTESSYDLNYQKRFFEDPLELVSIYDMIACESCGHSTARCGLTPR